VHAAAFHELQPRSSRLSRHDGGYFEAKMRLFSEVVEPDGTAVIWTDDPKVEEVVQRCRARDLTILTVGAKGETLRLVGRETTQLGPEADDRGGGKAHSVTMPLIGAYQAANVLTRRASCSRRAAILARPWPTSAGAARARAA
jgi:UDP-N-acetylmuramoyl-L-alanyl-D-glutamate--2,6-diaminopimelate ligase